MKTQIFFRVQAGVLVEPLRLYWDKHGREEARTGPAGIDQLKHRLLRMDSL